MINLNEYVKKVEWLCIDYDNVYWHQCVDLIKHYSQNVLGLKLWSFGGSAKTGWFNKSNTFPSEFFEKIINTASAIPQSGDIIFIKTNTPYWHVAIVLDADIKKIKVLEQNTWNWNWRGYDDRVKISEYNYDKIIGWYHYINESVTIVSEIDKKLEEAKNLWIWNWDDEDRTATRKEVVLIIMKLKEILENKFLRNKQD